METSNVGVKGYSDAAVAKRAYHRRADHEPRRQGHETLHKRGQELVHNWPAALRKLGNEAIATYIGKHLMAGDITERQASAGRLYAMAVGRHDRFFGITNREMKSASYDAGFGGQDDEVARRERDGTIAEYERRAKKVKRRWERMHDAITDGEREVVERVCVRDLPILSTSIPVMVDGLQRLSFFFGLDDRGEFVPRKHKKYGKPAAALIRIRRQERE